MSAHVQGNSWYQSVCRVSLTVSVNLLSLSEIRVFHWKLRPSESVWCRVSPLLSKLLFRSFSVGHSVFERFKPMMTGFYTPFSFYYTPAHIYRERWQERPWIFQGDAVPLEKEEPWYRTSTGEGVEISHPDHSTLQCKNVAHDATQKRTEILVNCAQILGLRRGATGNNPLSRWSTRILPQMVAARGVVIAWPPVLMQICTS